MKVMFVCLGNICRSPAAEGILRKKAEALGLPIEVDSSGLGDWYLGQMADQSTRTAALRRGVILAGRAKKFLPVNFEEFDYILAADKHILHELQKAAATPEQKAKLSLITDFSSAFKGLDIPDPFHKGEAAFEHILDMLEDACDGLLKNQKNF